jgi:hypothetical protein
MKLNYFLLTVLLLALSCKKEKNLDIQKTEYTAEILSGNQQYGIINQELDSIITIKITNKNGEIHHNAKISFLTSNGSLFSVHHYFSDVYKMHWLLGCDEGIQDASIVVKDSADRLIDTLKIFSSAVKGDLWNRVCGLPLKIESADFLFAMTHKIIEHPDGTLYVLVFSFSDCFLYSSVDNGENWTKKFDFSNFVRVHDIVMGSNGDFFMSSDKGLFKSSDCKNWNKVIEEPINKCFPVDDNTLFACGYIIHYIYRSDDIGETWNRFQYLIPMNIM